MEIVPDVRRNVRIDGAVKLC